MISLDGDTRRCAPAGRRQWLINGGFSSERLPRPSHVPSPWDPGGSEGKGVEGEGGSYGLGNSFQHATRRGTPKIDLPQPIAKVF